MVLALQGVNHRIVDYMGIHVPLPFAVALSTTKNCNSRCQLCNIWRYPNIDTELDISEWEQILLKMSSATKVYIFTGGEPFLRKDLPELLCLPFKYGQPSYLSLSTNGLCPERVHEYLKTMIDNVHDKLAHTTIYCNVSVDGLGFHHDKLRGVDGNFEKVLQTIQYLRGLRSKNPQIKVGIHIVISMMNVSNVEKIIDYFFPLPYIDSITCQLAEHRKELQNIHKKITPSVTDYRRVIKALSLRLSHDTRRDSTIDFLQKSYYTFVDKWLTKNYQPFTCYAGRAFCQITSDGKVVSCGTRWLQEGYIGDLREMNYDLKTIWNSNQAVKVRKSIRDHECACPLRIAYYTSLTCHLAPIAKIIFEKIRARVSNSTYMK